MQPLDYCRDRAAPPGSNRYYAVHMALPEHRTELLAVHALYLELTAIPLEISDPGVAAVKLQWWREELQRARDQAAGHPAARLLQPLLSRDDGAGADCLALLEGVTLDLEYGSYPGVQELTAYCHQTGVPYARLLARICDRADMVTERFAHDLGMGLRLQELLLTTREHARRGRCYLPEDEMRVAGVRRQELLGNRCSNALRELFGIQAQRAEDFLVQAQGRLDGGRRPRQRSNIALAALYRALLGELRRSNFPLLTERQELTPLRRLWIAWRAARRAGRGG